jgi:predicted nucleotidyltransferase component of viral defense system
MKLINSLLISRQELENLVNLTATYFNLLPAQIFQDLIAWSFLKSLAMDPDHPFVFRGGTSLSQAFQLIHRFSEEIDVSILHPQKSLSFRKKIKQTQGIYMTFISSSTMAPLILI